MHADAAVTGLSRTPATALRNTVQPLADVVNVTLKSRSGQTANHIEGRSFANVLQWSISAVGAAAFASLILTGSAAVGGALSVTGATTLTPLAGTGTRLATASSTGVLGTTTATAFGLVSGTSVANRVAYWSATDAITGSANLTFDGTTLALTGAQTISSTLDVTGALTGTTGTFSNRVSATHNGVGAPAFFSSGAAATNRDMFGLQTSGVNRWLIRLSSDAESGSDAGSAFQILARTDAGAGLDTPVSIVRAAGGLITFNRPVAIGNALYALSVTAALNVTGTSTFTTLAGSGTRLVTADATGVLGTTTASSFGLVSGTGIAFRVAFWSGTSTISSANDFYSTLTRIFVPALSSFADVAVATTLDVTGAASFVTLAGTGTRFVTASNLGVLGTTTISGSGGVLGTSVANRVAYWSATDTITGSANLTFSGSALVLTGTQTISSTLGVSGLLTGAAATFSGTVTGNQSGSGTSSAFLASAAAPTITITVTGAATNEKNWDIQGSATTLLFRTRTDANGTGVDWMVATRSTTTVTLVAFTTTAATFSGTVTATGLLTASAGVQLGNGSGAPGRIYTTATAGTIIYGAAGSSFDFILANSAGANVFTVPTGTTTAAFAGNVTIGGTLGVTGNTTLTGTLTGNSTGLNNLVGPLHIGTTGGAARAFRIAGVTLSGDNQIGALISPTFTSASTTTGTTLNVTLATAASAFTMVNGYGILINAQSIGSGSAITTSYGLKIESQAGAGTNYAIFTGTGLVTFGDLVTVNGGSNATAGINLGHVTTNATQKQGRIKTAHYTNAEEPVTMFICISDTTTNMLYIGGVSGSENAVTGIDYYTAATSTTLTGTRRGGWSSAGVFDVVGNATIGGTLNITGSTTYTSLAGTGTRLVTSTSTGVLGNATSVAGSYEFNGITAFAVAFTFSGNGTPAQSSMWRSVADGISIRGINGSTNAFTIESASGTIIMRNPQATTGVTFPGAVTMDTTLSVTGAITTASTLTIATTSVNGSLLAYTNSTGSCNYSVGIGGSSGGAFPNGAYTIRDTTAGAIRFTIASTGAVTIAGATALSSTLAVTSAITATGGIVFNGGGTNLNHYETGSFTGTLTGCTTSPTLSINYVRIGNMVMLHFTGSLTATSNASSCTITGVPTAIRPATAQCLTGLYEILDNGAVFAPSTQNFFEMGTGGALTGYSVSSATGFASSGTKGIRKTQALGSGGFSLYYCMT